MTPGRRYVHLENGHHRSHAAALAGFDIPVVDLNLQEQGPDFIGFGDGQMTSYQEPDRIATMAEAQAEHIRNSGGRRLFDDGVSDEERQANVVAMRLLRARQESPIEPEPDIGDTDIPY